MMNWKTYLAAFALLWLSTSCRELPRYFVGDKVLARVADKELCVKDVQHVVPQGVAGKDSVAYVSAYVDRWVRKQVKLHKAEEMFSESVADIDQMVQEYRQTLLIRKLDQAEIQHRQIDTLITDKEIKAYYEAHKGDFRLDRPLVKGRILRFKAGYRQTLKLKKLMASQGETHQRDFMDICAKQNYTLTEFRTKWVDFSEFLSYLPALRNQNYDSVLGSTSIQEMSDNQSQYFYQIEAVLKVGESIPEERLRENIRRILYNQRQGEVLKDYENRLYDAAVAEEQVEIMLPKKGEQKEKENKKTK